VPRAIRQTARYAIVRPRDRSDRIGLAIAYERRCAESSGPLLSGVGPAHRRDSAMKHGTEFDYTPSQIVLNRRRMLVLPIVSFFYPQGTALMAQTRPIGSSDIKKSSAAWRRGARPVLQVPIGDNVVEAMAWRRDSARVAVYLAHGPGFVADPAVGTRVVTLPAPESVGSANAILFAPDGASMLLSGRTLGSSGDESVAITQVDSKTGSILREIKGLWPAPQKNKMINVPDRMLIDDSAHAILTKSPSVAGLVAYDLKTFLPRLVPFPKDFGPVFSLRNGSSHLAAGLSSGEALILDRLTGAVIARFEALPAAVTSIKYSPDGSMLLTGMQSLGNQRNNMPILSVEDANRRKIFAWNATNYTRLDSINADLRTAGDIQFHPDGDLFAVATIDDVALFDAKTLELVGRFKTPTRNVRRVMFSPDGTTLAIGGSSTFSVMSPQ
jgi:WD40 repeat protein